MSRAAGGMEGDRPPSRFSRAWPWLAAALSGLLLALCFVPFNIGGLAFVALVPLLCAVWLKKPARRAGWYRFRLGYVTGLVFYTITFSWLSELGPLYDNTFLRTLPFWLAVYLGIYPALWAWFAGWIAGAHFVMPPRDPMKPPPRVPLLFSTHNLALSIMVSAAWVATEWLRGPVITNFAWNALGVSLYHPATLTMIQMVEYTGVAGLSFVLMMCNAIGLITVLRLREEIGRAAIRPHFDFSFTVALVVALFFHGVWAFRNRQPAATVPLRVVAVQPNIPQKWKLTNENDAKIFERLDYLHGVAEILQPDLVLWPEASVPGGMLANADTEKFVIERAAKVPALLLGTDDFARNFNSAAFFVRGRKEVRLYDKRSLVAFGEFLPARPLLGWALGGLVPGDFEEGKEVGVFDLPEPAIKFAPLICFEDTVGNLVREPVQLGAQVLVNVTNDGWFGESAGPEQHFVNSIFRAIENRRPLIHATNTGVTASVDPVGNVVRWTEPFSAATVQQQIQVPTGAETTFYTRNGEVFAIACSGLTVLAIAGRVWLLRRRRTRVSAQPAG